MRDCDDKRNQSEKELSMITPKSFWQFLALAIFGLLIVLIFGFIILAAFADKLTISRFLFIDLLDSRRNSAGDELTGEVTAILFGASIIPIGIGLILRMMNKYVTVGEIGKGILRQINTFHQFFLVPFHTYLSILALGVGILHLTISSCVTNPLPEIGLFLAGILVGTGLLYKWKTVPTAFRKYIYKFHASLIVSGLLSVILLTGHAVMDVD
jgi:hypothetical protein